MFVERFLAMQSFVAVIGVLFAILAFVFPENRDTARQKLWQAFCVFCGITFFYIWSPIVMGYLCFGFFRDVWRNR